MKGVAEVVGSTEKFPGARTMENKKMRARARHGRAACVVRVLMRLVLGVEVCPPCVDVGVGILRHNGRRR